MSMHEQVRTPVSLRDLTLSVQAEFLPISGSKVRSELGIYRAQLLHTVTLNIIPLELLTFIRRSVGFQEIVSVVSGYVADTQKCILPRKYTIGQVETKDDLIVALPDSPTKQDLLSVQRTIIERSGLSGSLEPIVELTYVPVSIPLRDENSAQEYLCKEIGRSFDEDPENRVLEFANVQ